MTAVASDFNELLDHPGESSLLWSVGRSQTSARWNSVGPHSWLDFVKHLNPEKPSLSKEVHPYVGGTLENGRRTARTVKQRHLLTLDADYADVDFLLDIAEEIEHPYLVHTTWRHTPETPRYRLIIPLDRGVSPNEYKELAWLVMHRLGGDYFDKTTVQPERFMWGPSTQSSRHYFWGQFQAGQPYLPVSAWLDGQQAGSQSRTAPKPAQPTPTPAAIPSASDSALEATEEDAERAQEILASAVDEVLHLREREKFEGRNEAVFHLLPTLLRFADAGLLDEDLILDSLFYAAQQVPSDEPYTQAEFQASVASAKRYAEEEGPALPDSTPFRRAIEDFADISTTGDLWTATPQFRHIAQAADNTGRNRLAMLAAVIVRILARVDAGVCLVGSEDGSVGSRAALNLGVALVGSSGQGKSTIQEKSGLLVPTPGIEAKPSTGQGLIQAYLEWNDPEQKHELIADPRRLFFFDEVDTLTASAADKTSTLMSEIRTMLTGGATGTENATATRRRFLPSRSYNFQMMLNVQPSRAGGLLRDRDAGTPQRFIWATVTDPKRAVHPKDRPPWPGPLPWNDAFMLGFEVGEPIVQIPQWLKDELLDYDYRVSQEGMEGGEVSWAAHQNLLRLKVSTGIAFMHESPEVLTEHVQLADLVISESLRVQRACEELILRTDFEGRVARARSDERVIDLVNDEKLKRLVTSGMKKIARADGEWVPWRDLRPQYRDREVWSDPLWEAFEKDNRVETQVNGEMRKVRWVE